jgi:multicomponent Na+:H+ antiporter subunit E
LFLLLFLFWLLLNGRVTIEIAVIGAAASAALTYCANKVLQLSSQKQMRLFRSLPGVFFYLLFLLWQIIVSNLLVLKRILTPAVKRKGKPKLIWFKPGVDGQTARLALANSITLTPGTVTAALRPGMICVYTLGSEFESDIQNSGFARRLSALEGKRDG